LYDYENNKREKKLKNKIKYNDKYNTRMNTVPTALMTTNTTVSSATSIRSKSTEIHRSTDGGKIIIISKINFKVYYKNY
jgi:hypothetical protein